MSKHKTESHPVRAGDNRTLTAKAPELPEGAFTSASLEAMETTEGTVFMRRVYDAQVRGKLAAGKKYYTGVAEGDLQPVEGSARMHKEARDDCRWLLLFARQELARLHSPITIGIASAYRSAEDDGVAWRKSFRKHYKATKAQREKLATGAHGDEAFRMLMRIMPGIKAPAGFSNHTQGRAVDFSTEEVIDGNRESLTADTSQHDLWRKSWFFKWLVTEKNAAKYRFVNLATEEWHYDHQADMKLPEGKKIPENPQGEEGEVLASNGGNSPNGESKT